MKFHLLCLFMVLCLAKGSAGVAPGNSNPCLDKDLTVQSQKKEISELNGKLKYYQEDKRDFYTTLPSWFYLIVGALTGGVITYKMMGGK